MSQSKKNSLCESISNLVIGNLIFFFSNKFIFSINGVHVDNTKHFQIALFFSTLSVIRSYAIRRFFNRFYND